MNSLLLSGFSMYYIVDAVCAVFVLILAIVHAKKGFIKCLFGIFSVALSIILALIFAQRLSNKCEEAFGFITKVGELLEKALSRVKGFDTSLNEITDKGSFLETVGIPNILKNLVEEILNLEEIEEGMTIASVMSGRLAGTLCKWIAGIVLYFGIRIVSGLLGKIFTKIAQKSTGASSVNVLLGAVWGIVKSVAIVCIVLAIFGLFSSDGINEFFNSTLLVSWLYNNNPILLFFN